jgi:hypothetical protein
LPTTYVFDPEGNPAIYKVGLVSRESLEEFMRENSKNPPSQRPGDTRQQKQR